MIVILVRRASLNIKSLASKTSITIPNQVRDRKVWTKAARQRMGNITLTIR